MPLCHGAGGSAGQYYFGARTGGTNILEGLLEIVLGLFLAVSIAGLFTSFPGAIIGGMMLLVAVEMVKLARDTRWSLDLAPLAATVAVSALTHMALASPPAWRRITCFIWPSGGTKALRIAPDASRTRYLRFFSFSGGRVGRPV